MSSMLESITEIGLRRLYKFILKRVLSQILLDDLSLDQISMTSRDGTVQLTDLALNCEYLNQFLDGMPIRIRSCSVKSIIAKFSYTSILEDGVSFDVSGVEVELEPYTRTDCNSTPPAPSSSSTGNNRSSKKDRPSPQEASSMKEAEVEGLKFLANWVEIIIAKLKVGVTDVNIYLFDSTEMQAKSTAVLLVTLGSVNFFNSHPRDRRTSDTSIDLARQGVGASISNFGKRKVRLITIT